MSEGARLYLVGTPIGNLGDLSKRATELLKGVDLIAAEDTRRTGKLLAHIGSDVPTISFHAHNEEERVDPLLDRIAAGESIALVCDAGMPGISDPAERLVRAAIDREIDVVPIPGPTAFVTGLVASGLPTRRFRFEGYLPSKGGPRRRVLTDLRHERLTLIFHESPRRITRLLEEIEEILGPRRTVLGRELTKVHEEFLRGTPGQLRMVVADGRERGEFVVFVEGAADDDPLGHDLLSAMVRESLEDGLSLRDAVRRAAKLGNVREQEIYKLLDGEGGG